MKKVILFAAAVAMVALASCKKGGEATESDSTMVDTNVVVVDTAVAVVDTAVVADSVAE